MSVRPSRSPGARGVQEDDAGPERGLLVMNILLTSVIVGGIAGWLTWMGGANLANAVLAGGAAFAGSTLLLLAVVQFLSGR